MASVNKVILLGNLTRDVEVTVYGQQKKATFSVATSERFKDKQGQVQQITDYHNCELWGMEGLHQYLTKGTQVYLEGSLKTDSWEDNGQKKYRTYIKVFNIQLVGSRQQNQQGQQQQKQQQQYAPQQQPQYQQAPAPQYAPPQQQQGGYYPPQQQGYYPQQGNNNSFPQSQRVGQQEDPDLPF